METLLSIVVIVFGFLQIILFFKLWGMTNDIKDIKNKYLKETTKDVSNSITSEKIKDVSNPITSAKIKDQRFNIGELVVIKATEEQFRIVETENIDGINYYSGKDSEKHTENDITLFDEYWKQKKSK